MNSNDRSDTMVLFLDEHELRRWAECLVWDVPEERIIDKRGWDAMPPDAASHVPEPLKTILRADNWDDSQILLFAQISFGGTPSREGAGRGEQQNAQRQGGFPIPFSAIAHLYVLSDDDLRNIPLRYGLVQGLPISLCPEAVCGYCEGLKKACASKNRRDGGAALCRIFGLDADGFKDFKEKPDAVFDGIEPVSLSDVILKYSRNTAKIKNDELAPLRDVVCVIREMKAFYDKITAKLADVQARITDTVKAGMVKEPNPLTKNLVIIQTNIPNASDFPNWESICIFLHWKFMTEKKQEIDFPLIEKDVQEQQRGGKISEATIRDALWLFGNWAGFKEISPYYWSWMRRGDTPPPVSYNEISQSAPPLPPISEKQPAVKTEPPTENRNAVTSLRKNETPQSAPPLPPISEKQPAVKTEPPTENRNAVTSLRKNETPQSAPPPSPVLEKQPAVKTEPPTENRNADLSSQKNEQSAESSVKRRKGNLKENQPSSRQSKKGKGGKGSQKTQKRVPTQTTICFPDTSNPPRQEPQQAQPGESL